MIITRQRAIRVGEQAVSSVTTLAINLVIAYACSPTALGEFSIIVLIAAFAQTTIINSLLPTMTQQYFSQKGAIETLVLILLGLSIAASMMGAILFFTIFDPKELPSDSIHVSTVALYIFSLNFSLKLRRIQYIFPESVLVIVSSSLRASITFIGLLVLLNMSLEQPTLSKIILICSLANFSAIVIQSAHFVRNQRIDARDHEAHLVAKRKVPAQVLLTNALFGAVAWSASGFVPFAFGALGFIEEVGRYRLIVSIMGLSGTLVQIFETKVPQQVGSLWKSLDKKELVKATEVIALKQSQSQAVASLLAVLIIAIWMVISSMPDMVEGILCAITVAAGQVLIVYRLPLEARIRIVGNDAIPLSSAAFALIISATATALFAFFDFQYFVLLQLSAIILIGGTSNLVIMRKLDKSHA